MEIDLVDDESIDGLLRASAAFGQLDATALALLRDSLDARVVRNGEVLMHQGDAADGLYLVGSGRLQVKIEREDGSEEVISEVGRGDLVGEMALLTDGPRSATITALRDSHVLFLSSDAFARVVQAHPHALPRDLQCVDHQVDVHDSARRGADAGDEHRDRPTRRE